MNYSQKLSERVNTEVVSAEADTIDTMAQQLGVKLMVSEKTKMMESGKKFVDVFTNDLIDFKLTIDDATYEDIDYLGEFNGSKQVVLASSDIKDKVITSTNAFDKKMQIITNNEIRRNLFEIVMQKSKEAKGREILVGFMDYIKHKQDEFALFSQEIAINISNLKNEKEMVGENARVLAKKAITLTLTSTFFKSVLPEINLKNEDYQAKLVALDRRLRTMYEILYVTKKSIIDIENQMDMFNELQNVLDEYKVSAMRIVSIEIKNRVVLQDIKEMYTSLKHVRETINSLTVENSKITTQLVEDIHTLSKDSILDKNVMTNAVESATQLKETKDQRSAETHKQIQKDNKEYLDKINQMVSNEQKYNERHNSKKMLEL